MLQRILVISLVLVNILLLGWNASGAKSPASESVAPPPPPPESSLASIGLVSELSAEELQARQWLDQCYRIGPLQSEEDFRQVEERMRAYVRRLLRQQTQAQVDKGYWVYLPAPENRELAIETTNQLASMGLEDYFVVTTGEHENTVSLGLFSEQRNASNRQEQLRSLGYDARIQVNRDTVPQYWLDYELLPNAESPWRYVLQSFKGSRRLAIHCESLAPQDDNPPAETTLAENESPTAETPPE